MKRIIVILVFVFGFIRIIQAQEIPAGWYGTIGVSGNIHVFHNYAATFRTDDLLQNNGFPSSRFALMGNIGMWKQVYRPWGIRAKASYSFLYGEDNRKTMASQLGISYDLTNLTERESPVRFMILGGASYVHIFKDLSNTRGNAIGVYAGVNLIVQKYGLYVEYSPMSNRYGDRLDLYSFGFSYYFGVPSKGSRSVF